jgi:hypothetical protein
MLWRIGAEAFKAYSQVSFLFSFHLISCSVEISPTETLARFLHTKVNSGKGV